MAGYCTSCGGTGFRKPSRDYKGDSAYVRMMLGKSPADIGAELERLQKIIADERGAAQADRIAALEIGMNRIANGANFMAGSIARRLMNKESK